MRTCNACGDPRTETPHLPGVCIVVLLAKLAATERELAALRERYVQMSDAWQEGTKDQARDLAEARALLDEHECEDSRCGCHTFLRRPVKGER